MIWPLTSKTKPDPEVELARKETEIARKAGLAFGGLYTHNARTHQSYLADLIEEMRSRGNVESYLMAKIDGQFPGTATQNLRANEIIAAAAEKLIRSKEPGNIETERPSTLASLIGDTLKSNEKTIVAELKQPSKKAAQPQAENPKDIIGQPKTVLDREVNIVWSLLNKPDRIALIGKTPDERNDAIAAIAGFLTDNNNKSSDEDIKKAAYDAQGYNSGELFSMVNRHYVASMPHKSDVVGKIGPAKLDTPGNYRG